MLTAAKYACLVLLFLLGYSAVSHLLRSFVRSRSAAGQLNFARSRKSHWSLLPVGGWRTTLHKHLSDLIRSTRLKLRAGQFILFSLMAGSAGVTAGLTFFANLKGVLVLGVLMLFAPYVWLRSRLITLQMKNRIDFLPAVESFYQVYVLSETKNVRTVLKASLDGDRIPLSVRQVFEQLCLELMVHRDTENCLRVFSFALGNRYADHFAAMLRFALEDGADLSDGLRELIADMRSAIRTDHAERNRLLEIRIANFSPLLFLVVFLFVNFRIDFDQSYQYYVVSETGRNMLLDALLLIGASFGMGLYLSMRKI